MRLRGEFRCYHRENCFSLFWDISKSSHLSFVLEFSVNEPVPAYRQTLDQPVKPLTIGVAREYFGEGLNAEVEQAVRAAMQVYRDQGATLKEVSLPHSQYAIAVYYIVATAEASSNLARYDGVHYGHRAPKFADLISMYERTRGEGFGPEVQRRVMLGTYALSSGYYDAYYLKAMKVRWLIKEDFDRAFADFVLATGVGAVLLQRSPDNAIGLHPRRFARLHLNSSIKLVPHAVNRLGRECQVIVLQRYILPLRIRRSLLPVVVLNV